MNITNRAKTTDDQIEILTESLTNRIIEIRLLDVEEIKTAISSFLKLGILDCLHIQISETEKKLNQAKFKYQNSTGNSNWMQTEIVRLKEKLKAENLAMDSLERTEKHTQLINYLKDHNPDLLQAFYNYWTPIQLSKYRPEKTLTQ